jgi:hypothetical protein
MDISRKLYNLSVEAVGKTMTAAMYDFNALYDNGEIDGFPESAIEVLQKHYGKRLEIMRTKTILNKVIDLQRCITDNVDNESCIEAVNYYIQN